MSNRPHQRRSLVFENLEGKTSPTPVLDVGWLGKPSVAEVASHARSSDERFLRYVAQLQDISIERAMPTEADSNMVDQMLASSSPHSME